MPGNHNHCLMKVLRSQGTVKQFTILGREFVVKLLCFHLLATPHAQVAVEQKSNPPRNRLEERKGMVGCVAHVLLFTLPLSPAGHLQSVQAVGLTPGKVGRRGYKNPFGNCYSLLHLAWVGLSTDSKASWRRMKWFLRSLTLRAMPLRWFFRSSERRGLACISSKSSLRNTR